MWSCAGGVAAARPATQRAGGGATPTPALHALLVRPIPFSVAKAIVTRDHYLHTLPGGTRLAFGVFSGGRLLGTATLGVGPFNVHRVVQGATPNDCMTLTRLWLSDELPQNSESRVLGVVLRHLRRHTSVGFLVSYADPAQGHLGTVYQATNWLYTGRSQAMPLYDLGDGVSRHSRSLSHSLGSHSTTHFRNHGVSVKLVPQAPKHRYVYLLDPAWRGRLRVPVLSYPKQEVADEGR